MASPSFFTTLDATQISYRKPRRVKRVGRYALGRVLGEGSYGKVKEGVDLESKERVAVKIFAMSRLAKLPGAQALVTREIALLRALRHAHIVHARDDFAMSAKAKHYVVLEFVGGGTLQGLLEQHAPALPPLSQTRHILKGITKALEHLEQARVVHRDIKPDNILLTEDGDAKLSDFGVALQLHGERWDELDAAQLGEGSLAYQPPECHEGAKTVRSGSRDNSEAAVEHRESSRGGSAVQSATASATPAPSSTTSTASIVPTAQSKRKRKRPAWMRHPFKVDVWSLGVVLYVMVTGSFPFPNDNLLALFAAIADGAYTLPSDLDPELAALLRGMLCVDAAQRLDARGVLSHAWLSAKLPKGKRLRCATLESAFGQSREELDAILEAALDRSASAERGDHSAHSHSSSSTSSTSNSSDTSSSKRRSKGGKRRGSKVSVSHDHDNNNKGGTSARDNKSNDTSDSATPLSGSFGDDDDDNDNDSDNDNGKDKDKEDGEDKGKGTRTKGTKGSGGTKSNGKGNGKKTQGRGDRTRSDRRQCCTLI